MSEELDQQIYACVQRGDRSTLAALLQKHPEERTSNSSWIVGVAVLDNPEMLPWLFEQGVSPDCRLGCDDGEDHRADTPLMTAISYHELDTIRTLLEHGADPNARDSLDETCFTQALVCCDVDAMKLLVEYGADVLSADPTRVWYAKYFEPPEIAETLHLLGFPIWEV